MSYFDIRVVIRGEDPANGSIESSVNYPHLKEGVSKDETEVLAAINTLESMILAHACAGVDISTTGYIEGIETSAFALFDKLS